MASRPLAPNFTRIPRRSGESYSHKGERAGLMLLLYRIAAWPLVVKVPVLAAGLMIAVAYAISQVVLWRSVQDEERNLRLLTSAYLDGLSAAILPATIRGDVWEVFDALVRGMPESTLDWRLSSYRMGRCWRHRIHFGSRVTVSCQILCAVGSPPMMVSS